MKACEVCGAEYEPAWNRPEQKYCSSKCREKAKHYYPRSVDVSKPTKNCEICGNAFNPHKFNPHQKYCSQQCKMRAYNQGSGKALYRERRLKCIEIMGGHCKRCGSEEINVLEFDHIYSDPDNDPFRKRSRRDVRTPKTMFRWILKNPDEAKKRLQLLCSACNRLKSTEVN